MFYALILLGFFSFSAQAMEEKPVTLWAIHEVVLKPSADDLWLPSSLSPKSLEKELIEAVKSNTDYVNVEAAQHPGNVLPLGIKAWVLNLASGEKLKEVARAAINGWTHPILYNVAGAAFSPKKSASYLKPIQEVVALVQACKNKGNQTILASNWNSESFAEIERQHPIIVELFKDRFISGELKKLTMEPTFFEKIMETNGGGRPYYYVDIEEGQESLNAAREAGVTPIAIPSDLDNTEFKNSKLTFDKFKADKLTLQLVAHKLISE